MQIELGYELATQRPWQQSAGTLLAEHALVVGQTGSGKSNTALRIIEQLKQQNQTVILFDPTGEYQHLSDSIQVTLGQDAFLDITRLSVADLLACLQLTGSVEFRQLIQQAMQSLRIQKHLVGRPGIYRKQGLALATYEDHLARLGASEYVYDVWRLPAQIEAECVLPADDATADYRLVGQVRDHVRLQRIWPELMQLRSVLADPTVQALFHLKSAPYQPGQPVVTQQELRHMLRLFSMHQARQRVLVVNLARAQGNVAQVLMHLFETVVATRTSGQARFPVTLVLDEAHRYLAQVPTGRGLFVPLREGRKWGVNVMVVTQEAQDLPEAYRYQFYSQLCHRTQRPDPFGDTAILQKLAVGQFVLRQAGQNVAWIQGAPAKTTHPTESSAYAGV